MVGLVNEDGSILKDADEVRAEIDDEGLDWETAWLLEDENDDTPPPAEKKGVDLDLDARLNRVDYTHLMSPSYKPSVFAYEMVNFIKLVNGVEGEENKSPVIHYDMFDQVPAFDQNLFVSFRGSAKALALNEEVLTPDGSTPIKDLHVGDKVFDRNGVQTTVILESKIFNKPMYLITLDDGRTLKVSDDHINIVNKITTGGKFVEHRLSTLNIISKGVHFNRKVSDRNPKGTEGKWYIPLNGCVEFNEGTETVDAYTTGVILGDGNIGKDGYTRIHTHVDDVTEMMCSIPYKTSTIRADKRNKNTVRFSIRGISKDIKEFIGTANCYSKTVPKTLVRGSINQRLSVLQGLMDTDGTVSSKGNTCSFTTVSKGLADDVTQIVRSLGGRANCVENMWKSGHSYRVHILSTFNPFRLKRKASLWKPCKTNKIKHVAIKSIVEIKKELSKCIGVESDTKTFLTKNCIVTGNTTALHEYTILYIATYGCIPNFGNIDVGMYISDTMDNGIKSMRSNLEFRWDNSEFLQRYVPYTKFTDVRWEFKNADGKKLCFRGFGASPLALDEVVHTENGTTTMKDVAVGDRVYGSNGTLATVVRKSDVFLKDMYRITLKDGRSLRVSSDHLNSVYVKVNHKFVKKVLTTEEILRNTIKLTGKNEYRYAVPMCDPVRYPTRELPVCPYTLGLILGDGRSRDDGSNNLSGCIEDLKFYSRCIPYPLGEIYADGRSDTVGDLPIKKVYKGLRELGVQGCNTYDKFIPDVYKTASVEQRLELLRGLMDTDGTVYGNGRVSFTNTSAELVAGVKTLVESLGGYTSIKTNPAYTRQFKGYLSNCRESFTLSIFMRLNMFKLPRKSSKFVVRDKYNKLTVASVEKTHKVPSQCIRLDNENHEFVSTNYFVTHNTGVRGFKEYGQRPTWAGFDDLMSDKNAVSPTIQKDIKHIIYKAARQALHPKKRKQIWTGTPFNKSDPLYEAAGSGAWNTRVYPIAEKFPCRRAEFRGGWEDRFSYDFVKGEFRSLKQSGEISSFNQELMLRITSDEDRLVQESDIVWYSRDEVIKNRGRYNFYITTDFATVATVKGDFSVIIVWAYSNNGDWLLVDGVCKKQLMDVNIKDLFRLVSAYKPLEVGIEINGQQTGFISWIKDEMLRKNIFFNLAGKGSVEGVRRSTRKIDTFKLAVPIIKAKKLWLPKELKNEPLLVEFQEELRFATGEGFKSKNDDVCDGFSMLLDLDAFPPGEEAPDTEYTQNESGTYALFPDDDIYSDEGSSTVF